jgi:hypothetical protein
MLTSYSVREWITRTSISLSNRCVANESNVTAEEAAMLAAVFAEDGELPARPAGTSTWKQ